MESFEKIARDALSGLIKAGNELDEAERIMSGDVGTAEWYQKVAAWKIRKDAIIDCSRNSNS